MPSKEHWKGKTVLICGASDGLGSVIATELAKLQPAQLALLARREDKLVKLKAELQQICQDCQVEVFVCDLGDLQQTQAVAQHEFFSDGLDLLIQAVGMSDRGTITELSSERVEQLIGVNVITSINALQSFGQALGRKRGMVTLIGSLASLFAPRFLGGYAIAKHALAALAQQARLEFAEKDVGVCLVCPGPIAREDAGQRYQVKSGASDLPAEALKPGGGAKIKGLNAEVLAGDILQAAANRKRRIIRPRKAWILHVLSALSPAFGDKLLGRSTS